MAPVGLRTADPLANKNRLQILGRISQSPGVTPAMLQNELELGRATVQHHVRILTQAGLIESHRTGKIPSLFLNSGSYAFQAGETTASQAYAALGHPARQQIADAVTALGKATYAELRDHWQSEGQEPLRPDAVSYHAGHMQQAGYLQRTRRGRGAEWSLTFDPKRIAAHQRQAFIAMHQGTELLGVAEKMGAATEAQLLGSVGLPRRQGRRALKLLLAIGALQRDGDGRFVAQ